MIDTELFSKSNLSKRSAIPLVHLSYLTNAVFGEDGLLASFAIGVSKFVFFVVHVVGLSPKVKMSRVYARRVVAFVKDLHSFWNIAIMQNPRNAMGGVMVFSESNQPISKRMFGSHPNPATLRFLDVKPESRFGGIKAGLAESRFLIGFWAPTIFANPPVIRLSVHLRRLLGLVGLPYYSKGDIVYALAI